MIRLAIALDSLPSLALSERARLPYLPCVYIVTSADRVLYVGGTTNLRQRWMSHHRYTEIREFDDVRIAWAECSEEAVPVLEPALIIYLQPILNAVGVKPPTPKGWGLDFTDYHHQELLNWAFCDRQSVDICNCPQCQALQRWDELPWHRKVVAKFRAFAMGFRF